MQAEFNTNPADALAAPDAVGEEAPQKRTRRHSTAALPKKGVAAATAEVRTAIVMKGKLNAGKDEAANALVRNHGFDTRIAFADALRATTVALWNDFLGGIVTGLVMGLLSGLDVDVLPPSRVAWPQMSLELCADRAGKEQALPPLVVYWEDGDAVEVPLMRPDDASLPVTPRWLLQYIGTDICRTHIGPLVWVRAALDKIGARAHNVVFTDARFEQELVDAPAVLRDMGFAVSTWNVVNPHEKASSASAHSSESAADGIATDAVIVNDKTLGLEALADAVARTLAAGCDGVV